jgi:RNA polymerase sigma-70 factor (ECF subfamily)
MNDDADMDDDSFAETIREELLRKLHCRIESLPSERRKIIMLSLNGHSREDIAAMLGISPNTVKAQKTSAMKTLREALRETPLIFFL